MKVLVLLCLLLSLISPQVEADSLAKAYFGATVDDPDDEDVPSVNDVAAAGLPMKATGRTLNWTTFMSHYFRPWQPIQVGVEYQYWVTQYRGLLRGENNRVSANFTFYF